MWNWVVKYYISSYSIRWDQQDTAAILLHNSYLSELPFILWAVYPVVIPCNVLAFDYGPHFCKLSSCVRTYSGWWLGHESVVAIPSKVLAFKYGIHFYGYKFINGAHTATLDICASCSHLTDPMKLPGALTTHMKMCFTDIPFRCQQHPSTINILDL